MVLCGQCQGQAPLIARRSSRAEEEMKPYRVSYHAASCPRYSHLCHPMESPVGLVQDGKVQQETDLVLMDR
jgi:hypothetical protein